MPTPTERFSQASRDRAKDFSVELSSDDVDRLANYYELVLKWNPRLHLVGPCSPEEFATRHVLESLVLLKHLSPAAVITDIGSGAGLPIIPCLIVRADLRATLIESSQKKSVFLKEALKRLPYPGAHRVLATRFEETPTFETDFVTCRALERFQQLLPKLVEWAPAASTLLLFAGPALRQKIEALLPSATADLIPGSEQRFLMIAQRGGPRSKK
jgi:16S rRNA (guanine527-N7)-methyltransferase